MRRAIAAMRGGGDERFLAHFPPPSFECKALRSGLENNGIPLIAGDDAIELFQVLGPIDGDAQFFYLEGTGIAHNVAINHRLRVITSEAVVGIDRRGQVIHGVARRYVDFKRVGVAYSFASYHSKTVVNGN